MRVLENNQLGFISGGLAATPGGGGGGGDDFMYSYEGDGGGGGGGWAIPNGCTGVPNEPFGYNFKPACDNHDINYSSGTNHTKSQADSIFLNDMLTICKTEYNNDLLCRASSYTYYTGVTIFGGFFYEGGN
jgi:hypothetical protein